MPRAFLCDFDGTMAPDVGEVARRFGVGREKEWEAALARWRTGTIGTRELTRLECQRMVATREQAMAFARSFGLDSEFPPFTRDVLATGGAAVADDLWARGSLLEWCRAQGIPASPFQGFAALRDAVST